jgi:hypothetical protein
MFKSIGGFFRDIVAPVALAFIPKIGPYLAATYSGINTGIKTGSPLAGLGSAGLSLGLSSAFKGLTAGKEASQSLAPVFKKASERGLEVGGAMFGEQLGTGTVQGAFDAANKAVIGASSKGLIGNLGTTVGGAISPTITNVAQAGSQGINFGAFTDPIGSMLPQEGIGGQITEALPDFIKRQSPLTVGGVGLALKTAATPPPEPAPFGPMQTQPARDFSKYGYKGPLNRGDYTYADPEDIAYGRVTPGSYGYLGAKEGGPIKLSGGGVGSGMMQYGAYNPAIERQKGTFRPTGSMVAPQAGPAISRIAQTQPMMSVSPQKIAGLAQPVAPTVPTTNVPMSQPKAPTPMPMPQPQQQGGMEEKAQQLINDLPQKDISVNIDSIRQFIGLAEGGEVPTTEKEFARLGIYKRPEDYDTKNMNVGGEVPGMAKPAPAGMTGQSSNIDMSAVNYGKPTTGLRKRFDNQVEGMFANLLGANSGGMKGAIGRLSAQMLMDQQGDAMFKYAQDNNLLRGLGGTYKGPLQRGPYRYPSSAENLALGKEDVSKIGYESVTYPGVKNMAEGGEVQSDETLQSNAFVIPADVVGHIGDGSSDAGAQRLQSFLGMNPQQYQAGGIMAGELQGPGGGMDDLIQTSIEGKRAAAVSPQEFVVPRDIVAELGQGSYDKGSNKLYALMRNVRKAKTGTTKQPAELTRGLGQLMRTAVA